MAVALDASAGGVSSNSYATVDEADAYFATQLYAEAWTAADADTKARALITATTLLDENVVWRGSSFTATQALGLPRSGLPARFTWGVLVANLIPTAVVRATAELARQLIEAEQLPDAPSDTTGIKKIKAGSVELEFDGSQANAVVAFIPARVFAMVSFLVESTTSARTCVPLVRS